MQPLHTGHRLPLLHPVLFSCISNLRFTHPVFPPSVLPSFPFPSDTHKPSKAAPSALKQNRLTDLPVTVPLCLLSLNFSDHRPFRTGTVFPPRQHNQNTRVLTLDPSLDATREKQTLILTLLERAKAHQTALALHTLCPIESSGPGVLLVQVSDYFYRCLEPLGKEVFPEGFLCYNSLSSLREQKRSPHKLCRLDFAYQPQHSNIHPKGFNSSKRPSS